jgi:glycosyltransferase involved in cell wall biosynthesis
MDKPKIAIVAEWLTSRGGAEQVVDGLISIFPDAQIFTSVFAPEVFPELVVKKPITSFLQKIPRLNKHHQRLGALMPSAFKSLDFTGYDIIISSSSAFGKGIRKPKGAIHICYCHTPIRYVWQPEIDGRLARLPFGKAAIGLLKKWDLKTNKNVDYFITNSPNSAQRIKKFYNREATVIYPPVCVEKNEIVYKKANYYLQISRFVAYKRFDLSIKACENLHKKLIIAGSGEEESALRSLAKENTEFVGRVNDKEKIELISKAKAVIFPGEEDFGIVPIEAMALGTPVIGFGRGGTAETVTDGKTGVLFNEQNVESLEKAIERFEKMSFDIKELKSEADKFSLERFKKEILSFVNKIKIKEE